MSSIITWRSAAAIGATLMLAACATPHSITRTTEDVTTVTPRPPVTVTQTETQPLPPEPVHHAVVRHRAPIRHVVHRPVEPASSTTVTTTTIQPPPVVTTTRRSTLTDTRPDITQQQQQPAH